MADESAKLSSLFGKKKKKTTVNANVIAKEQSRAESAAAAARVAAASSAATAVASPKPRAKPSATAAAATKATSSPAGGPAAAPVKNLSELSLGDKVEKSAFQWAKQPKKYKDTTEAVRACTALQSMMRYPHELIWSVRTDRRAWRARGRSRTRATARRAAST